MLRFPNCKINLGLYITNKRNDSYHDLETVFYPVALKDVLEIVPAKEQPSIHISGRAIEGDKKNNLVWKGYDLLKKDFPEFVPDLDIYLHKVIPMGAGLGGGSADGAFMLELVKDYCNLPLTQTQLAEYALQLGSDCPFFIYNTPQFATGRGEIMTPITIDLSSYSIQLICPHVHISTVQAFQALSPKKASFDLTQLGSLPVNKWKDVISNDFEDPVFEAHPYLNDIKQQLYNQGAVYASMSGSGSALYGIFAKGQQAVIKSELQFESYHI